MSIRSVSGSPENAGICTITMDAPPVNALTVAGWFELARALDDAGRDAATRVVILRAEGRGFNAGVDIKEMQSTSGFDALLGANKGCFAAFKAVYECPVPVIAAVHGFCLGGGVGLVGNADCVVASDDAYFGVPEVKQGALGAATHLARLVPQHLMRTLYYTARTIPAAQLVQFGGGRGGGRVDHRPHLVLRHEPSQVGGGAECAPVDLGQAEGGVVGRHDDIGVADQTDAAAEAETVDRGDHRNFAVVHGGEGGEAAAVGADQRVEPFGVLHLLDVDAGVEAAPFGPQHHHVHVAIAAGGGHLVSHLVPTGDGQRVDWRVVHDDLGDVIGDRGGGAHGVLVVSF